MQKQTLNDAAYQAIGKRWGSESVAAETSVVAELWTRDAAKGLAKYGYGKTQRAAFDKLRADHAKLMEERPGAIAAKAQSVKARNALHERAWSWVNQVSSILSPFARARASIADQLRAATPADDSELGPKIGALATVLGTVEGELDAEAEADARIGEVADLQAALGAAPGQVAVAKGAPIADTAEVDVADGELVVFIRDFYEAGRKAIRDHVLAADASSYRFTVLKHEATHPAPKGATQDQSGDGKTPGGETRSANAVTTEPKTDANGQAIA